jgi:hypothetical protein
MSRNEKAVMGILLAAVVCLGVLNVYQAVNPSRQVVLEHGFIISEHGVYVTIQTVYLHNMTLTRNTFLFLTGGDLGQNSTSRWINYTAQIYTDTFQGKTFYYDSNGWGLEPVNYTYIDSW